MIKTAIILVCLIILISCTPKPIKDYGSDCFHPADEEKLRLFVDSTKNFQMLIPDHWLMTKPYGNYIFAMIDTIGFKKDSIRRMLTLEAFQLPPEQSFEEYLVNLQINTSQAIKNAGETDIFKITSIEDFKWNNKDIQRSITVDTSNPMVTTTTSQVHINNDGIVFVITIGTQGADIEQLNCKYSDCIKSLKWIVSLKNQ